MTTNETYETNQLDKTMRLFLDNNPPSTNEKSRGVGGIFFCAKLGEVWEKMRIFATYNPGLYGFDGKSEWYVSMRSFGGWLLNLSYQRINWRK